MIFYIRAFDFWNFQRTWDSTDDQASIYGRKTAARHFDTTHDILRSLNLAQYFREPTG